MATQNPEQTRQARETARELVSKLRSDPAFKRSVEDDPKATLVAAGLPGEAVEEFVRETNTASDVQGYAMCDYTCWVTCLVTHVPPA